jgi:hypothetical protein
MQKIERQKSEKKTKRTERNVRQACVKAREPHEKEQRNDFENGQ